MKTLVTGSSGHLGEALMRTLREAGDEVVGLDILPSPYTDAVGSIADSGRVRACMLDVHTVYHAATLHKPHLGTHDMQAFIDTNVTGTLTLLREALRTGVSAFVYTSTTSVFGDALRPAAGAPAVWVTEDRAPVPRNIYGVSKSAGEALCELFHRRHGLSCLVLRTSRFFPEADDDEAVRRTYDDGNVKANEFLYRRVDLHDVVSAHRAAARRAPAIGFGRYVVSATTPFLPHDAVDLRIDAPRVLRRRVPGYEAVYGQRRWRMFETIDRVYDNTAARTALDWTPRYDFAHWLRCLRAGEDPRSPIAVAVGSKGYHAERFDDGPYPVR